jgi:hypothetical protein
MAGVKMAKIEKSINIKTPIEKISYKMNYEKN